MSGFCYGLDQNACTPPLVLPPNGEAAAWAEYLAAVRAAPAKLAQLKTGLPTSTVDGGFNPIPGDSDDTTGYPYSAKSPATCSLFNNEKRDLNRLNDFRIIDLDYFPKRKAEPCGLLKPEDDADRALGSVRTPARPDLVTERVTELVLGWHAGGVDDHLNDTALWVRPTLVGLYGLYFEAASWVWEVGVGTILLPFALLWSLFSGNDINLDSSYALARQYNPVDEIQGAIPGVGDIRSDDYTGLWHFESVDAGVHRFNDTRGMWYPGAGPDHPGALDVAILAFTQATGLSLNAHISEGPSNYGGLDRTHRTWPQWQAHSVGMLEWSPLHNLAAYGWNRFKSDPSNAVGLGWPLHAIGDASEPHHVTSTTAWGHVPYEKWVNGNLDVYMPSGFDKSATVDTQDKMNAQLADSLVAGFRWWKQFKNGENMATLIHDLAADTRAQIRAEGDWPYKDSYSTREKLWEAAQAAAIADYGSEVMKTHEADITRLLNNGVGAAIAVLTIASQKVKAASRATLECPNNGSFIFEQHTKRVQPARGPAYDAPYTVPTCGPAPAALPANPTPASVGVGQFGAGTCAGGAPCKANNEDCTSAAQCASNICDQGSCGRASGGSCVTPVQCSSGRCSANGVCVNPNGWACTSAAQCVSGSCSAGVCGSPGGASCSKADDCASAACVNGKCLTPTGGACTNTSQCLSGVPCFNGLCGKPNMEFCSSGDECISGECSEGHCGKGYQDPCSDSSECSNNNCIDGLCGPGS
jgi:hypothetical protein